MFSPQTSYKDSMVCRSVATTLFSEMWLTGLHLRQNFPTTSFDIAEDSMKQALATGLIITQKKVIANPPTFVKITKKYQRRASTPALSSNSSLSNSVIGAPGRAGSPEVSTWTFQVQVHPKLGAWESKTSLTLTS